MFRVNIIFKLNILKEVFQHFNKLLNKDAEMPPAVAAIKTILEYVKHISFCTISELRGKVIATIEELTKAYSSIISVKSGCELLLRFMTLTTSDEVNYH